MAKFAHLFIIALIASAFVIEAESGPILKKLLKLPFLAKKLLPLAKPKLAKLALGGKKLLPLAVGGAVLAAPKLVHRAPVAPSYVPVKPAPNCAPAFHKSITFSSSF